MSIEDGGQAFPGDDASSRWAFKGMTLRDWFAGQALAGAIAEGTERMPAIPRADDLARFAYDCADAMLKARQPQ